MGADFWRAPGGAGGENEPRTRLRQATADRMAGQNGGQVLRKRPVLRGTICKLLISGIFRSMARHKKLLAGSVAWCTVRVIVRSQV
jgi:hypothetical protein